MMHCSTCCHHKKVAEVAINKFDGMWLFRCDRHGVHLPHVAVDIICRDFRDVIEGRNEPDFFRSSTGLDLNDLERAFLYWKNPPLEYPLKHGKMLAFSQLASAIDKDGNFLAKHIHQLQQRLNHKDKRD